MIQFNRKALILQSSAGSGWIAMDWKSTGVGRIESDKAQDKISFKEIIKARQSYCELCARETLVNAMRRSQFIELNS